MENKQKELAIKLLAQGKSENSIAETLEVSQSTISRFKSANANLIKKETERLLSVLPDITDQLIRDLKTSDKLSKVLAGELPMDELSAILVSNVKVFTKFMELSYKQKVDILKAIGVYPSNSDTSYIQQNFFNNSQAIISPMVMTILGKFIKDSLDAD